MEILEMRRLYWDLALAWGCGAHEIEAHTSGSTGMPKRIMLPREAVRLSAIRTNTYFGINAGSRLHSCVSPQFIGGKMMMIRAIEAGAILTYEVPSNNPILPEGPTIDLLAVVPSMMHSILRKIREGNSPKIRNILIGGSAIPPALRKEIADSGVAAFESYGMTETCSHIALRKICASEHPFTPLPGIGVSADTRGCLCIDLPGIDERIVTNDIVDLTDDGFRILGRADSVIVTGGLKVYPEEIERKLAGVFESAFIVSSRPSELWGEEVIVWIEDDCVPTEITPDGETVDKIRMMLKPQEVPKSYFCGPIPRTASGKVIRRNLPFPSRRKG